jgi:hypothetical protein
MILDSHNGQLHARKAESPVAAQFEKLDVSEQEGPMTMLDQSWPRSSLENHRNKNSMILEQKQI